MTSLRLRGMLTLEGLVGVCTCQTSGSGDICSLTEIICSAAAADFEFDLVVDGERGQLPRDVLARRHILPVDTQDHVTFLEARLPRGARSTHGSDLRAQRFIATQLCRG